MKDEKLVFKQKRIYRFFKRLFDIIFSFIALVLISWLLLILAIIVKCSSRGPVIFKDKRVGKKGKDIIVYKFRTMVDIKEEDLPNYLTDEQLDQWKRERKIDNDPRITKVGKFLRKTSLDELPQLWNIFIGNMTFVGNRPITRMEIDTWFTDEEKKMMFTLRPGLTGYWQAYGRSNITFESGERQKLDIYYTYHRSMWLDIKILFRTVGVVLFGSGAK